MSLIFKEWLQLYIILQINHQLYILFALGGKSANGAEIFPVANKNKPTYDAYEKDIAVVTFFFESPTVFEYLKEPRMTLLQFISQMGGLLGLCIGLSFISVIEILYWCIIRFARNL